MARGRRHSTTAGRPGGASAAPAVLYQPGGVGVKRDPLRQSPHWLRGNSRNSMSRRSRRCFVRVSKKIRAGRPTRESAPRRCWRSRVCSARRATRGCTPGGRRTRTARTECASPVSRRRSSPCKGDARCSTTAKDPATRTARRSARQRHQRRHVWPLDHATFGLYRDMLDRWGADQRRPKRSFAPTRPSHLGKLWRAGDLPARGRRGMRMIEEPRLAVWAEWGDPRRLGYGSPRPEHGCSSSRPCGRTMRSA